MDEAREQPAAKLPAVKARQGTGPRAMVSVLTFSLFLAAVAGSALLAYFVGS